MKHYDVVIAKIINELDQEQAQYQELHKKLYGEYDKEARRIYKIKVGVCERIREELFYAERE